MNIFFSFYLYFRILNLLLFSTEAFVEIACPNAYSCITSAECSLKHRNGVNEVLFQCDQKEGKVCCPDMIQSPQQAESTVFPVDLTTHRNFKLLPTEDECGYGSTGHRITEGEEAGLGEFPWMALVGFRDNRNTLRWRCGGSLIHKRYVLTAAHCVKDNNFTLDTVRLGEHNIKTNIDCGPDYCIGPPVDIPVEAVHTHERWNDRTLKNDIALLRLKSEVKSFNRTAIVPVCLPFNATARFGGNETETIIYDVAGWGITDWDNNVGSDKLLKTNVNSLTKEECNICKEKKQQVYCPIDDSQVCVQGYRGKDVCKGDSGGPLMLRKVSIYQIGITSFKGTERCGAQGLPSIFTRLEKYLPWILDKIKG